MLLEPAELIAGGGKVTTGSEEEGETGMKSVCIVKEVRW